MVAKSTPRPSSHSGLTITAKPMISTLTNQPQYSVIRGALLMNINELALIWAVSRWGSGVGMVSKQSHGNT